MRINFKRFSKSRLRRYDQDNPAQVRMAATRTMNWPLTSMRPPLSVGLLTATSVKSAWARLLLGGRGRIAPPPLGDPNGIRKLSANRFLTENTRDSYFSRKLSVQAFIKSKAIALWIGISTPILMEPSILTRYLRPPSRKN